MRALQAGTRGLWLLFDLNKDRLIFVATILGALLLGAFMGSL